MKGQKQRQRLGEKPTCSVELELEPEQEQEQREKGYVEEAVREERDHVLLDGI